MLTGHIDQMIRYWTSDLAARGSNPKEGSYAPYGKNYSSSTFAASETVASY